MSVVEFILGFAGIIIGLGVADLLVSFHRLLRAADRVKWDWLALSFAALMLFTSVCFWWFSYSWYSASSTVTIASFLPKMAFLCLTFLQMAAALPDEVPEHGVVLRDFYMSSARHLWTLVSASLLLSLVIGIADDGRELAAAVGSRWPVFISTGLALACLRSRRVWLHALAIAWIATITGQYYLFQAVAAP